MDARTWVEAESTQAGQHDAADAVALRRKLPLHGGMTTAQGIAGEPVSHDLLIEAVARDRDKAAFAALFGHFAPRLKSYLMRLGTEGSAAEEVVQEAMVMVWRKAESFDRRQASASTWIFTIARNKRIDRLRRERRPELDPNDPALVPDPDQAADRTVEARQARERVLSAMEKLPVEQSELIRLAYFDDKSHAEIAAEKELPLGTVKSRIRLALGRMRREVGDLV
jgi:RNA polymerase sigma-70 factor (ECF subfamily)